MFLKGYPLELRTAPKPTLTAVGKTGELKVKTYVLVGFISPSRRTLILRTSVTPCSAMNSRICLLVTLLKAGQRTIPFDVFSDEWGVTEHLSQQNVFICRRVFSCVSFAHSINKSPDLNVLMLFGSPVKLMIVLCTKNGDKE